MGETSEFDDEKKLEEDSSLCQWLHKPDQVEEMCQDDYVKTFCPRMCGNVTVDSGVSNLAGGKGKGDVSYSDTNGSVVDKRIMYPPVAVFFIIALNLMR